MCIGRHELLSQQGISVHMIWFLSNCIKSRQGNLQEFDIKRGVRQGRVISPRLLCRLGTAYGMLRACGVAALVGLGLIWAMAVRPFWTFGLLMSFWCFATTYIDAGLLLDEFVVSLSQVGFVLNNKQNQGDDYRRSNASSFLSIPAGLKIDILDQKSCRE